MRDNELTTVMKQITASGASDERNYKQLDVLTWRNGPQEDIL
jgi:hypothetical protein